MGVKEDLIKEESGSPTRSQVIGASWVRNERSAAPNMPELTASAEAASTRSHQRTTSEFISAKRQHGAEPPAQQVEERQTTGNAPSGDEAHQTTTARTSISQDPNDPYAHIRNQPRRTEREPPIAPVPAYEAYEVVATPVFEKDGASDEKKNPLKDWRVWVAILVVAAIVGLSVGLAMKSQSVAPAQSLSGPPELEPTLPPAGDDKVEDPKDQSEEPTSPSLETEPPASEPTEGVDEAEEPASPPAPEQTETTPTEAPPTTTTDPPMEESRLANCSKDGGPSILLNEFSMSLATVSTTRDELTQGFVDLVFQHLWATMSQVTNVKGYSIKLGFALRALRGFRRLQGTTIKPKFTGCIDLFDDTAVPTYAEVQAAINDAFSGANLDAWLDSATGAGFDFSSVTVFDASGQQIGSSSA